MLYYPCTGTANILWPYTVPRYDLETYIIIKRCLGLIQVQTHWFSKLCQLWHKDGAVWILHVTVEIEGEGHDSHAHREEG